MNKQERMERAVEFHGRGYNCCQSASAALVDLTDFDAENIRIIGAGFAGGMGDMSGICGALAGAVMIAGGATGGNGTVFKAREISKKFREMSGAIICRELKGIDTGKVLCPCDNCIQNAVAAYCDVMEIE